MTVKLPKVGKDHRDTLVELLKLNGTLSKPVAMGVEIGVRHGETAELLLEAFDNLTLGLVDPYTAYTGVVDTFTELQQRDIYRRAMAKLKPLGNHYWLESNSIDALCGIMDETLDFVFIDARHEAPYVLADVAGWYFKVRQGGLITGHDYDMDPVHLAVDAAAKVLGKTVYHLNYPADIWVIEK